MATADATGSTKACLAFAQKSNWISPILLGNILWIDETKVKLWKQCVPILCHIGASRFGQVFLPLRNYLKPAFCIFSGYLCIRRTFVWWSESFRWHIRKNSQKGGKYFFIAQYIRTSFYLIKCKDKTRPLTFKVMAPILSNTAFISRLGL